MGLCIGVDFHARKQTVSYLKTEDGATQQKKSPHDFLPTTGKDQLVPRRPNRLGCHNPSVQLALYLRLQDQGAIEVLPGFVVLSLNELR